MPTTIMQREYYAPGLLGATKNSKIFFSKKKSLFKQKIFFEATIFLRKNFL